MFELDDILELHPRQGRPLRLVESPTRPDPRARPAPTARAPGDRPLSAGRLAHPAGSARLALLRGGSEPEEVGG